VVLVVPLRDSAGQAWEEAWSFELLREAGQTAAWRGVRDDLQLESGEPMHGAMSQFLANRRITSICESLVHLDGRWLLPVLKSFARAKAKKAYNLATHNCQHYSADLIESIELPGCHRPLPADRIDRSPHATHAATSARSSPAVTTTPHPSPGVSVAACGDDGDRPAAPAAAAPAGGGNVTVLTIIGSFFTGLFAAPPAPTGPVPVAALRVAACTSAPHPRRAGLVRALHDVELVDVVEVGAGASSSPPIFRTNPLHAHAVAAAAAHPG
jgi:hypothetical protein